MSNIPMPKNLPTTQQIDVILGSVISGSQTLLSIDMKNYANLRASFLKFYSHLAFQLLLGLPPQNSPAPPPPTGTPSAQGKGPKQAQTPTYASKAASKARPSLVLDIRANDSLQRLDSELAADLTD